MNDGVEERLWARIDDLIVHVVHLSAQNTRLQNCLRGVHDFKGEHRCPTCGASGLTGVVEYPTPIEDWPEPSFEEDSPFVENEFRWPFRRRR